MGFCAGTFLSGCKLTLTGVSKESSWRGPKRAGAGAELRCMRRLLVRGCAVCRELAFESLG